MTKISKLIASLTLVALLAVILTFVKQSTHKGDYRVAIVSIVEIEPISDLRKGFRDRFGASQFAKNHKVVFTEYNAQGESSIVNQIADKLATEKPNVVYALGTPVAQAIQKRSPDILIVQGAVTDPVAAGLANSWNGSGKNYIATSDLPPVAIQVQLIRDLTPRVRRVGIIYNSGEANSVAVVSRLRDYIKESKSDVKLIERFVANSSEVATAVQSLLGNADAIYLPPDNTVHAAIPVVGKYAHENKLPFYATVKTALDDGAVATLSQDFVQLGRDSAEMLLSVIAGQKPAIVPIQIDENPTIFINAKVATALGVEFEQFRARTNVTIVK